MQGNYFMKTTTLTAKNILTGVLILATFGSACSSTTMIQSSDPSVKIYVDDEYKGTGSVSHSDTKIVGSVTQVKFKKEGCETQMFNFSRNEEFDAGACAGGVFLLFPFLWIQKYRPMHSYDFTCQKVRASR
jgi:hypothetical protein